MKEAKNQDVAAFSMLRRARSETSVRPWHKHLAVQLAGQLPDCRGDAVLVVDCLRELMDEFLFTAARRRNEE